MAALDDILAQRTAVDNQNLADAQHAATWTQTFHQPNSVENLRAQRNVTDLVNQAVQGRMALAAQTDRNAQQIYENQAKFGEYQQQAPLRDELLRSKIAAEGAATRYRAQQDAATANDIAGFYHDISGIQHPVNTPEHADAAANILVNHPFAATNAEVLKDYHIHSQVVNQANKISQAREDYRNATGFYPQSVETTATGGINLRGKADEPLDVPVSAAKRYALLQGQIAGHAVAAKVQAAADAKANQPDVPYKASGAWEAAQKEAFKLESQYKGLSEAAAPDQNVTRETSGQSSKPAMVKQNGVVYHLQSDGSYK